MPIECRSTTCFIGDPDILSKTCKNEGRIGDNLDDFIVCEEDDEDEAKNQEDNEDVNEDDNDGDHTQERDEQQAQHPATNNEYSESVLHKVEFDVHSLGAVKAYTIEGKGKDARRAVVPFAAMYSNRGAALRLLNRFEYHALVKVEKQRTSRRSKEYSFSPEFVLASKHTQLLRSKQ
jgi:hypothetical protein